MQKGGARPLVFICPLARQHGKFISVGRCDWQPGHKHDLRQEVKARPTMQSPAASRCDDRTTRGLFAGRERVGGERCSFAKGKLLVGLFQPYQRALPSCESILRQAVAVGEWEPGKSGASPSTMARRRESGNLLATPHAFVLFFVWLRLRLPRPPREIDPDDAVIEDDRRSGGGICPARHPVATRLVSGTCIFLRGFR